MSKEVLLKALDPNRNEIQLQTDSNGYLKVTGGPSGTGDFGLAATTNTPADGASNSGLRIPSNTAGNVVNFFVYPRYLNGAGTPTWDRVRGDVNGAIVQPHQFRGSLQSAYTQISGNTETTIMSASAGNFLDLVSLVISNNSTAAIYIDIRDVTAGNKIITLTAPANDTRIFELGAALPQGNSGNNWTAQITNADVTGGNTIISISALAAKKT